MANHGRVDGQGRVHPTVNITAKSVRLLVRRNIFPTSVGNGMGQHKTCNVVCTAETTYKMVVSVPVGGGGE